MTLPNLVLIVTATATGLIAGLFYAYSCSVNLGLGSLPDKVYLMAMQSINNAILNPIFFASFIGTLILLPASTYVQYEYGSSSKFILLLIASLLYATGVFGVTIFGNVPLNEMLAKVDFQNISIEDISTQRLQFEKPWNKLHSIRTMGSIVTLILVIVACARD
jgi:uncharacterized membrane protein